LTFIQKSVGFLVEECSMSIIKSEGSLSRTLLGKPLRNLENKCVDIGALTISEEIYGNSMRTCFIHVSEPARKILDRRSPLPDGEWVYKPVIFNPAFCKFGTIKEITMAVVIQAAQKAGCLYCPLEVVPTVRERFPNARISGMGFSQLIFAHRIEDGNLNRLSISATNPFPWLGVTHAPSELVLPERSGVVFLQRRPYAPATYSESFGKKFFALGQ
jgi:hypothetical protein